MKRLMLGAACAALASALGMSGAVMAGVAPTGGDVDVASKGAGGYVGLGASYAPDYEGGDDYEAARRCSATTPGRVVVFVRPGRHRGGRERRAAHGKRHSPKHARKLAAGPLLQYRQERKRCGQRQGR